MKLFIQRYHKMGLIISSIIFSLILVNVISVFVIYNDWILKTTSELSSVRWRLQWQKAHLKSHPTDYEIDIYDKDLGWSPLKNARNISSENGIVNFNSEGIRGIKNYSKSKPAGINRIIVIGDSYSFGENINDNETYSAQMEQILPRTEILNFAVHGYGLDQMYLRLKLHALDYNPDFVIYAFINDDINRIYLNFRDYMKPKYILEQDKLRLINVPILSPDTLVKNFQYRPPIIDLMLLIHDRITYHNNYYPNVYPLMYKLWENTIEEVKNNHATPIFLFLPTDEEMIDTEEDLLFTEQQLFSFCSEKKLVCFSARKYLVDAYRHGEKFNIHVHYEPNTNQIIAHGLTKDIQEKFPQFSASYSATVFNK